MLAEQIATLETNYADAQAKITAQDSSIETLTVSVAALTKDKLLLEAGLADSQKRVADLEAHNDETMAAVESLATAALDMLRVAQRPPGVPAAVIQFAPKAKLDLNAAKAATREAISAVVDADPRFEAVQQGVAEIMAGDTGDEQPDKPLFVNLGDQPGERVALDETNVEPAAEPQPTIDAMQAEASQRAAIATNDTPPASDDAMNRIHSTALPDNVMKADGPLPVFLQRDTVLQREGVNVLG